ncbi:MAG: transporter [Spirochaetes bacterium]|jgi:voltage-gated potassium channel|nr:transporter [Spirochaetota bacterium]
MRRRVSALRYWYRNSQYARPTVYTLTFLVIAGSLALVFELGENDQFTSLLDGFWWLIVTFSTTGYGDKVPVTLGGRILAVVTIFFGVGAMSLLSGGLASWLVDRNTKARRGLMEFPKLKDHLVICGWKADMKDILIGILHVSPGLSSEQIVLLSNVDAEKIEELKEEELLRGLKFVRGDYFSELTLDRGNVQQARKVLVIADTLESAAVSEVDSKTVMTVLTVKSMARQVYVTAEVLDRKFESYLKHANCDEILFSRDFSRQMLASTSATNGMSHIIHELLSHENTDSRLSTEAIPERYIGRLFKEFRSEFERPSRRVVLGVLENTGTPTRMKMEALREAQKTSDVSQLITNLQKVKGLEVNRPVFLPPDDYQLQQHSLAIVLEREDRDGNGTN